MLETSQADRLLQHERMVFEKLLTVVGRRKKLWDFRATIDYKGFLRVSFLFVSHVLVILKIIFLDLVLRSLLTGNIEKRLFESLGLLAVC